MWRALRGSVCVYEEESKRSKENVVNLRTVGKGGGSALSMSCLQHARRTIENESRAHTERASCQA